MPIQLIQLKQKLSTSATVTHADAVQLTGTRTKSSNPINIKAIDFYHLLPSAGRTLTPHFRTNTTKVRYKKGKWGKILMCDFFSGNCGTENRNLPFSAAENIDYLI